jgi:hypothetical protein
MAKTYRTAKGRNVDIGALLNQNEDVRAVGNMNVNARGDLIDSQKKTIERKNKQVQKQYRKQIRNTVTDDVVYSSKRAAQAAQDVKEAKKIDQVPVPAMAAEDIAAAYSAPVKQSAKEPEVVETFKAPEPVTEDPAAVDEEPQAKGGLAAAIAKARQVKQEPLKTPRQEARESSGVKKI